MADAADIALVRSNTNEPDNVAPFTDAYIEGLIDATSVDEASSAIWRQKAAVYAEMTDVQEAGASIKFSDLYKQAIEMSDYYGGGGAVDAGPLLGRAKTHDIVR